MSFIVNREKSVLYKWHQEGVFPKPLYKGIRGYGIYTESQVQYFKIFLEELDVHNKYVTLKHVKKFLKKIWKLRYYKATYKSISKEILNG